MANVDYPHGFRPVRHISGVPFQLEAFTKAASYGTALFIGDAVNQVADSTLETNGTPGTTLISGVCMNYGALSTLTDHLVIADPFVIFEAQTDGSLVTADQGLNANILYGAGSTTTHISAYEINSATEDTTSTLDVKLLRLSPIHGNASGTNSVWEVQWNNHRRLAASAGV